MAMPATGSVLVRQVASTADSLTLELTTGPILRSTAPFPNEGFDRIALVGSGLSQEVGAPSVPVFGALIAAPDGFEARIADVVTDLGTVYDGLVLEPVARPTQRQTTTGPRADLTFAMDQALYDLDTDYPPTLAELGVPARLRDQTVVPLRIYPVRYNPVTGTLRHHRNVRLTLRFEPTTPAQPRRASSPVWDRLIRGLVLNPEAVHRPTPSPEAAGGSAPETAGGSAPGSGPTVIELGLEQDGFYQVSGAELQAAGLNLATVDLQALRLREGGVEMAIRIVGGDDGTFDAGDLVEFYGRGHTGEFTRRRIYTLDEGDDPGLRMAERDVTPTGTAPVQTTHLTTLHVEDGNSEYHQDMANGHGRDHYFWSLLAKSSINPFIFTVPNPSDTADDATLRVVLFGRQDDLQNPDHHTRVSLNGTELDDRTWNGEVPFTHVNTFSQTMLLDGANTLNVDLIDDLGAEDGRAYLNYFELDYRADLVAVDDILRFVGAQDGTTEYRLSGFSTAVELYDITDPRNVVRCTGMDQGLLQGTDPAFEDDTGTLQEYLALTPSQRLSPASIEQDSHADLHDPANGADYLVISHGEFLAAVQPLLDLREEQGLRTALVDVDDVYDAFSAGNYDPTAIRDFIQYTYESWQPPAPSYVLLVGEANQDYLDNLGFGVPDFLPTHLFETLFFGQFPEDSYYGRVSGDDLLPDVLLGRLSVGTAAEASAVVDKIVAYETEAPAEAWNQNLLLIAGDDPAFEMIMDDLADNISVPPFVIDKVYVGDYPSFPAAKAALIAEIDDGTFMASYLGHGSVRPWAGPIFVPEDVALLSNTDYPLITALSCNNGLLPPSHPPV